MPHKSKAHSNKTEFSSWLENTRNTLYDTPMRAMEEYAALPIRKFSNKHSELAAKYIRFPSAANLISVSNWIQAKAVFDFVYEEKDPFEGLCRAAAYSYWHWAIRISRAGNSGTLLAGGLASSIFLLATIGDRCRSEKLLREAHELSKQDLLGNAGSKSGPFVLAMAQKIENKQASTEVKKQLGDDITDSSGALAAYQELVDCLFESNINSVEASILAACQSHICETRQTTDDETHDFDSYRDAIIPFEIIFYIQVRRWLGLDTKTPDHQVLAFPSYLLQRTSQISEDSVLTALVSRSLETMEERQKLAAFRETPIGK